MHAPGNSARISAAKAGYRRRPVNLRPTPERFVISCHPPLSTIRWLSGRQSWILTVLTPPAVKSRPLTSAAALSCGNSTPFQKTRTTLPWQHGVMTAPTRPAAVTSGVIWPWIRNAISYFYPPPALRLIITGGCAREITNIRIHWWPCTGPPVKWSGIINCYITISGTTT